jgi:outer membrane protein OmpA-like peptidoglycan-associated protein
MVKAAKIALAVVAVLSIGSCARQEAMPPRPGAIDCAYSEFFFFGPGSSVLSAQAQERVAQRFQSTDRICGVYANPDPRKDVTYEIVGHTDRSGSEWQNERLGLERAQAVAEFIIGLGAPRERICVVTKGSKWPLVRKEGPEPQNRRVELNLFSANSGLLSKECRDLPHNKAD